MFCSNFKIFRSAYPVLILKLVHPVFNKNKIEEIRNTHRVFNVQVPPATFFIRKYVLRYLRTSYSR